MEDRCRRDALGSRGRFGGRAVLVWSLFVSPNPTIEVARPLKLAIEFAVWLAAGAALWATDLRTLAIAFVVIALVSGTLNYVWD